MNRRLRIASARKEHQHTLSFCSYGAPQRGTNLENHPSVLHRVLHAVLGISGFTKGA